LGDKSDVRYPVGVPSLFRRKATDISSESVETASRRGSVNSTAPAPGRPTAAGAPAKAYTPKKGKTTPKRREAQGRRVEPPPANRREAFRRMRQKAKEERAETRAGMLAGKEEFLNNRDKGEERALIRDIVDSRRNVGTWIFGILLVVVFGSQKFMPKPVVIATNFVFPATLIAVGVDFALIARKIKTMVLDRYPKTTTKMFANYRYAWLRSTSFRFIRLPAPRVKLGDKI